jgi:PAS domain S-box-containing protein/putative nucleotidyltransferase with HDIG domain
MDTRFKLSVHFVAGLKVLAAVAGTELLIMLLGGGLEVEKWLTPVEFDFADALVLSITASLAIYYWVVRPLNAASRTIEDFSLLEDRLRKSETQYRTLFESNPQPMLIYDRETLALLAVNEAAADLYGYSRDEFLSLTVKDLYREEDHSLVVAAVEQVRGRIRRPGIWEQKKKDGSLIDAEVVTYDLVFNGRQARHALITDVTDRQKAEEDLRKALQRVSDEKARTEAIIAAIGDGITIQNRDYRVMYQNEIAKALMGDHAGEYCYEAFEGMERTCDACPVAEAFRDGRVHTVVRSLLTDRGMRHFENTASVLKDAAGNIVAGIEVSRDITERKKAEEDLRESEEKYRLLYYHTPIGIFNYDTRLRITDCNDTFSDLVKTSREDLAGLDMERLEDTRVLPAIRGILRGREGFYEGAYRAKTLPGEIWISLHTAPLFGRDGAVTGGVGIVEDITARKRTDEALKESESRYRTLAEASHDVIFVISREDKVEYINSFGAGLFGLRPSELIGSSRQTVFPDATETQRVAPGDVFETGQPLYAEYKTRLRSGELWLGTLLVPLRNEAGKTVSVMGVSRDISERKRSEEQIRRQLQQLSALRSIDAAISSSLDIRLTLDIFLEQVVSQLHVDAAAVLLLKPHTKMLEFAAYRGFRTEALRHTRLRVGEGNAGLAALKRSIVHVPDVSGDDAFRRIPRMPDERFVSYYGVPLVAKGEVKGVLEIFQRSAMHPDQGWQDFLESLALQAAIAIDNSSLFENLERSNLELVMAYDSTIEGWSRALDYRDKETEGHSRRVTEAAVKICQAMGMRDRDLTHARWGALLHDIGKLGVPDNILFKPGKLDEEEWKVMKRHPVLAYELLQPIRYLGPAVDIPYCHHEKWDGTGYPRGLKGEQIPLAARIFSIVDVWDALGSDRPYRPAWPKEKILRYLKEQTGKDFDPDVTEAFLKLLGEGAVEHAHAPDADRNP